MLTSDANSLCVDRETSLDFSKGSGRPGLVGDLLYQYQGFWCFAKGIESIKDFQQNFKALDTDLVIASIPKSGTIWLKALAFAIVNLSRYSCSSASKNYLHHPFLTVSPHELIPFIELKHIFTANSPIDETTNGSPGRIIATHVPCPSLPESIKTSTVNCKIIYLCRNPRDTFISLWIFTNKLRELPEIANGAAVFGPFWDHVLGYWKESLKNPHKVLFIT
ncbi:hypothetical protein MKX03_025740, partial [Papaver bracteatum]